MEDRQKHTNIRRYALILLLVISLVFSVFIFRPYLSSILTGLVFAYIFYPIHKFLLKYIKSSNISSFLVSIVVILLITIPLALVLFQVSIEANTGYVLLKQLISAGSFTETMSREGISGKIALALQSIFDEPQIRYYIQDSFQKLSSTVASSAVNFLFSVPRRIAEIFVTFTVMFFFLRDGKSWYNGVKKRLPLNKQHKEKLFRQIYNVTNAVIYGTFVMALIEGIFGAITFNLAGFSSPFLWGSLVLITAIVPILGATAVWVPATIFLLWQGSIEGAVFMILGGSIISATDFFIKPKYIGDQSAVHPLIIFLGFLGGIHLFGFIGIVVGPLILSLLFTLIDLADGGY